jgi:hypothetical protein
MAALAGEISELYFTEDEARTALPRAVSKVTWHRWRHEGKGPPVTWIGRFPFYRKTAFLKWLEGLEKAA